MLPRQQYLDKLIKKKDNGRVKIVTGLRRCGKSVLLFRIYKDYLLNEGIAPEQIIELALDLLSNAKYRNPLALYEYIRTRISDPGKRYYVLIDEIQFVSAIRNPYVDDPQAEITFIDVVLDLMRLPNADVYVTGSNSKMLSTDVLTQFRDRGDEIRLYPLSFAEFVSSYEEDRRGAWQDYYTYGGMPAVFALKSHEEKSRYLRDLFDRTYIKDVLERNRIVGGAEMLPRLLDILASSIGSLTNPRRLADTFKSEMHIAVSPDTIERYLGYFRNAFLLYKAERYDVKGRKYIKTPSKYYYSDPGLRNARLGFRQTEENHLMENVLYNDLIRRGFDVDVGVVETSAREENGRKVRKQLEVDFVINRGCDRFYIQSALSVADPEKRRQEIASLLKIPDSFKKIVVVSDYLKPWRDENGIQYVGVEHFLTDDTLLIG